VPFVLQSVMSVVTEKDRKVYKFNSPIWNCFGWSEKELKKDVSERRSYTCLACKTETLYSTNYCAVSALTKHYNACSSVVRPNAQKSNLKSFYAFIDKANASVARPLFKKGNEAYINALDLYTDMVAKSGLPFCWSERPEVRRFFQLIAPEIRFPARKATRERVLRRAQEVEGDLAKLLAKQPTIVMCNDYWSSCAMAGYLGITVHFIDDDFRLRSDMLAFHLVPAQRGGHTGDATAGAMLDAMATMERHEPLNTTKQASIDVVRASCRKDAIFAGSVDAAKYERLLAMRSSPLMSKLEHIVSDGAANMKKGTQLLNKTVRWCVAHRLQLVLRDVVVHFEPLKLMTFIANKLSKVSHLSHRVSDRIGRLVTSCRTRFNTHYLSLRSILKAEDKIKAFVADAGDEFSSFVTAANAMPWKAAKVAMDLFAPFEMATTLLGAEKSVTSSAVLGMYTYLTNEYDKVVKEARVSLAAANDEEERRLERARGEWAKYFLVRIKARLGDVLTDDVFVTAAMLDPRYDGAFTFNERQLTIVRQAIMSDLIAADVTPSQQQQQQHQSAQPVVAEKGEAVKRKGAAASFAEILKRQRPEPERAPHPPIHAVSDQARLEKALAAELKLYMETPKLKWQDGCPLAFWRENRTVFPLLAVSARRKLAVPATSVPVERLFSASGRAISPARNRVGHAAASSILRIQRQQK